MARAIVLRPLAQSILSCVYTTNRLSAEGLLALLKADRDQFVDTLQMLDEAGLVCIGKVGDVVVVASIHYDSTTISPSDRIGNC